MFACFLLWGPSVGGSVDGLTALGAGLFRPERELPIYALAVVGTILLSLALNRRRKPGGSAMPDACVCAWQCTVATIGALSFVLLCVLMPRQAGASETLPPLSALVLLAGMALNGLIVLRLVRRAPPAWFASVYADFVRQTSRSIQQRTLRPFGVWDVAAVLVLAAFAYIPNLASVAGFDFEAERLHHWDFFVMGPALGYLREGALGSEVYSQYGLGFPLLVAALAKWVPVTYPNVMRMAVIAACLYYAVLCAFLRALLRDCRWAFFGALLAVDFQLFQGVDTHQVLWQYPSSTIMRSPFDILVFCALLWDSRLRGTLPMVMASVCVGAALVFETDTGIYLALTFAAYLAMTRWNWDALGWRGVVQGLQTVVAPGTAVLVLGAELASRGQAHTWAFLSGWLEVFRVYPSGIGMLPINMTAEGLVLSFLVIGGYLAVACYCINLWRCDRLSRRGALAACLAIYGLCYLCQFIGRSHPYNLFHSSIPFAILTVIGIQSFVARIVGSPETPAQGSARRQDAAALLLVGCVLLHIATLHGFQDYPNVFHPNWEQARVPAIGPTFYATGVRVPRSTTSSADEFTAVIHDAQRLSQSGASLFFLVNNDPIYYLASGSKSRYRYSPLFQCLLTKQLQARFERQFVQDRVDYVFSPSFRPSAPDGDPAWDVRLSLWRIVAANYRLDHRCGRFDVWRRLGSADKEVGR